jgi:hypothetical protein
MLPLRLGKAQMRAAGKTFCERFISATPARHGADFMRSARSLASAINLHAQASPWLDLLMFLLPIDFRPSLIPINGLVERACGLVDL